jgi:hypothetical protein
MNFILLSHFRKIVLRGCGCPPTKASFFRSIVSAKGRKGENHSRNQTVKVGIRCILIAFYFTFVKHMILRVQNLSYANHHNRNEIPETQKHH